MREVMGDRLRTDARSWQAQFEDSENEGDLHPPYVTTTPVQRFALLAAVVAVLLIAGLVVVINRTVNTNQRPLSAARAPIEVSLSVTQTRVTAGQPISGVVVLTNTTSKDIPMPCFPGYVAVLLRSATISPEAMFRGTGCMSGLAPGSHQVPISIETRYTGCAQTSPPTPAIPQCLAGPEMPPLPAGRYETEVFVVGLPTGSHLPAPIQITVD